MRGNAIFCIQVHIQGADLHFQRTLVFVHDRRVQGLIKVILGRGDVVVELAGDGTPRGVDHAQRGITGGHIRHDQTHGAHIIQQVKRLVLLLHLFVDRIDMLRTSADLGFDVVLFQQFEKVVFDILKLLFAVGAAFRQLLGDLLIFLRADVPEAEVFQFPLQLPDTEPVGERTKNIERFLRDAFALVLRHVTERAHIVQAVCQFDQHHAHILAHGKERLAQSLGDHIRVTTE